MKTLVEYVNEARVTKMNRKKFIQALASYGEEQKFTKMESDSYYKYKSYPKPHTMIIGESVIEFFYEDGTAMSINNYFPNNRIKNKLKIEARSYSDRGAIIDDMPILVWSDQSAYFDITELTGEEINGILDKIKGLLEPKVTKKIFDKYFIKTEKGYKKKSNAPTYRYISYEDIK